MRTCPITYRQLEEDEPGPYSTAGLRSLSSHLTRLDDLEWSAEEQRREARNRADKLSIAGVQPKLSARLKPSQGRFRVVDRLGAWILKPQVETWENLPENEDLTMRLAATAGIEAPPHGLIRSRDGSWTYFIKRFDRAGTGRRIAVEDFGQLAGLKREVKYDSSMEKVAALLTEHVTFPAVQRKELLKRVLVCFLTGNEDMHLKNFSVITRGGIVELAPAYDFLNTTLALRTSKEELALPLRGRRQKLTRDDFLRYYGGERLGLNERVLDETLGQLESALPEWRRLIERSFLPEPARAAYLAILEERRRRLWA